MKDRKYLVRRLNETYGSVNPEWDALVDKVHKAKVEELSDEDVKDMLRGRVPAANMRGIPIYLSPY